MTARPAGGAVARAALAWALVGACTRPDPPSRAAPGRLDAPAPQGSARPDAPPPSSEAPREVQGPVPRASVRYAAGAVHSPVTALVARSISEIAARDPSLRGDVFAKVGDSLTASGDFVRCFARDPLSLGAHGDLRSTILHFRGGDARGVDPYRRLSWAATIGWSAWQVLHGGAPPLAREHADVRPRFALVQFGTNDIEIGALHAFSDHLLDIVDWLAARGTIPILFTLPPRLDDARANGDVPRYSAAVRLAAMARRVPLVDFGEALRSLPNQGIGPDGIHPTSYQGRRGRDACDLGEEGLKSGYNLRNLLALQALARARQALAPAPGSVDPDPPPLAGAGAPEDPHPIASLPFFDVVEQPDDAAGSLRDYSGCAGARPAPGRERVYRLTLTEARRVEVIGFDRGGAEADVALLEGRPEGSACRHHGRRSISAVLGPGTWFVVVDPVTARAGRPPGATLLAVL